MIEETATSILAAGKTIVGKQNRDENDAPYLGLAPSRPQHQKEKCLASKHEEVDACILFDIVLYH